MIDECRWSKGLYIEFVVSQIYISMKPLEEEEDFLGVIYIFFNELLTITGLV